jgi:hypothetical protein
MPMSLHWAVCALLCLLIFSDFILNLELLSYKETALKFHPIGLEKWSIALVFIPMKMSFDMIM